MQKFVKKKRALRELGPDGIRKREREVRIARAERIERARLLAQLAEFEIRLERIGHLAIELRDAMR
jgi:hypothetical protein